MSLFPLSDAPYWCQLLKDNPELLECVREISGLIEIEIPKATLEASIDLSTQIGLRVEELEARLQSIDDEFECLDLTIDALEEETNPEAVCFRDQMIARRDAKNVIKGQLETQIALLTPQIALFEATKQTLVLNSDNASFLDQIIQAVDANEDCADLVINGS
jgi:hypothetical protein